MWHKYLQNGWNGPFRLGGSIADASSPSAVTMGRPYIDVFIRGSDDTLDHGWFDGSNWNSFQSMGGVLRSSPTAVSWGPNRMDIFVLGREMGSNVPSGPALYREWFDGSWHGFETVGGTWTSAPAALAAAPGVWGVNGRLDVFLRATDYSLWHTWNDGAWRSWEQLAGILFN